MEVSSGVILIGIAMILVGAILIYKSLRASPWELKNSPNEVRYIGPIPIMINGSRRLVLTAAIVASILILLLVVNSFFPAFWKEVTL